MQTMPTKTMKSTKPIKMIKSTQSQSSSMGNYYPRNPPMLTMPTKTIKSTKPIKTMNMFGVRSIPTIKPTQPTKPRVVGLATKAEPEVYEYEVYEDVFDADGNVAYDYYDVETEVPVTGGGLAAPDCPPGFICGGGVSNGAINQNTGSTGGTKTVTIKKKKKRRRKVKKSKKCRKTFENGRCFMVCGKRRSRC